MKLISVAYVRISIHVFLPLFGECYIFIELYKTVLSIFHIKICDMIFIKGLFLFHISLIQVY